MRRSSSRRLTRLVFGMLAVGGASGLGCKQGPLKTDFPNILVEGQDGGVQTTFDLGQACVGYSSTRTLYLDATVNSFDVASIKVTAGGTFYSVVQPATTAVNSGTPVPFVVTFTPPQGSNSQAVGGALVITSDDALNSPLTIHLTGTVASAPAYSIFQATCGSSQACNNLQFNNAPVLGSQSQVVTVTNVGCPPLDLTAMLDAGNPTYSFSTDAGLSPLPFNESVPVVVTFSPTSMLAEQDALVFSSSYPDAGLPFGIGLVGAGISPLIVWDPPSWSFSGAVPGVTNCETFMLENTGTSPATIDPPILDKFEINGNAIGSGPFTIDAGWGLNTPLAAQQSLPCTVCVDFHDAGLTYSVDLLAPYKTSTTNGDAKAFLTSSSSGSLCTNVSLLKLPDDDMFCGVETGSFEMMSCTDGGSCVTVTSLGWLDAGGNFDNLSSLTPPPGGPPWMVCPGDAPLTVGVTFKDNGKLKSLTDTVAIASNATGQPITQVLVVPVTHAVPFEDPAPVCASDAGVGGVPIYTPVPCEVTGLDDGGVNFTFAWYYIGATDGLGYVDAGADDLDADFTPTEQDSYLVCVEMIEVDAGFGNCGFTFGGLDAGQAAAHMYCSAEPVVSSE